MALIALGLFVTSGQVVARDTPALGVEVTGEQGSGAYPAMCEEDATLPAHGVYRPKTLAALNGEKLGQTGLPAALVIIPVGQGGIAAEVVVNWPDWQRKGRNAAGQRFQDQIAVIAAMTD
ncbi:hypothetical protein [Asticcacaulis benevestitus]|uniref:Uncharacterized protein n=1 Tax=Asticcacaulis benevestitus DSM 16100 = ATCC BAA-896 TaxID=1121022 RepID=V4NR25_9CAUL|nr:hypothetical protein [Asticcacaulis benevestitus]ESQ84242.1 hypothetical protein ABENE_19660 [Asticcacaulis benevestitus DSM 16100 = ATCC BAA-896]